MQISFFVIATLLVTLAGSFLLFPLRRQPARADKGFAHWSILSVALAILLTVGLYFVIGNPRALTPADEQPAWQQSLVSKGSSATDQKDVGSVSSLIDGLAERLQSEPDDADGWLLLAKSYKHLGRMDDARSAYERAEILGQSDPAFATSLNDEPNGESGAAETSSAPEIRGRVSLAAQAADSVNSSDTVFVIAKAVDGSPMPLAVIKKPASELPFEFVLNDSASLVKGLSISSASKIIVTAKISPSGDALQPAAGLEATSGAISANETEYLELEINPDANPGNK